MLIDTSKNYLLVPNPEITVLRRKLTDGEWSAQDAHYSKRRAINHKLLVQFPTLIGTKSIGWHLWRDVLQRSNPLELTAGTYGANLNGIPEELAFSPPNPGDLIDVPDQALITPTGGVIGIPIVETWLIKVVLVESLEERYHCLCIRV